jgi:hypothetical protein
VNKNDSTEFLSLLTALSEFFPGSKVNVDAIAEGYFEDLQNFSISDVRRMFVQARRSCRFFPTIAELLSIAPTGKTVAHGKCWHRKSCSALSGGFLRCDECKEIITPRQRDQLFEEMVYGEPKRIA